ncbi:hypothetical protein Glove_134g157 [Diversispora epigaea]|uniref:Uncharacterized protein n=1 Tax=Diversispora epigaea TaxID=1348612 RepID=A0A397IWZ2_9GLOM|nr:hypothetical protein Glove_134g157 [Diversispora epigaea]
MDKGEWKYSKKRLSKHEFCAAIINPKKVICICGKIIKLNRKWDEDYLNKHANGNGCKKKIGQQTILHFFNTTVFNESEEVSSEKEYDSDICDNMDDDDIITVNSNDIEDNNLDNNLSTQLDGARRIEIIGKELFPSLFSDKFTRKKLNISQKKKLNRQIFSEAKWKIDKEGFCVRAKNCNGDFINDYLCIECKQLKSNEKLANRIRVKKPNEKNLKFTPNWYFENDKLKIYLKNSDIATIWNIIKNKNISKKSNLWITIANKGLNGAFENTNTFKGLCAVMCQAINLGRSIQGIRKLRANSSDTLTNPDLCFENVVRFKRFLDKINYKGPIVTMSDNTKLKPSLRYSSQLGCIVGSILSNEETKIQAYDDIPRIINSIKDKKAIVNYVRVYILQILLPKFSPIIIALIPNNGKDFADAIANIHKKLILEIASQLNISIFSIGSDGAAVEFGAQFIILNTKTDKKIKIINKTLNINFNCPVFPNIGPVLRIQDLKYARVLTFGKNIANFEHFFKLVNLPNLVLYKNDVIKLDRQDDGAAYRSFCFQNLAQCLNRNEIKEGYEGELVDSYLNRKICPIERIRMCMTTYFFLRICSLFESMVLLIKSHREYYSEFSLIPWMHGSEACEHVFGIARQINSDFDFAELLQMVSKISHYFKSTSTDNILIEKEKSVREGYLFDYNKGHLTEDIISNLTRWPTIRKSRQLACELAEHLNMLMPDNLPIENLQPIVIIETDNDPEISVSFLDSNEEEIELNENINLSQAVSKASSEISNIQTTNDIEDNENIDHCEKSN